MKRSPPSKGRSTARKPGVRRTPDPAGVLPDNVSIEFGGDAAAEVKALAEILTAASPQGRVDRLALVDEMGVIATELQARLKSTGGNADDRLLADIALAEHRASYLKTQAALIRDHKRQAGTRKERATKWPLLDRWLDDQLSTFPTMSANGLWRSLDCARDDLYLDGDRLVEQHEDTGRERGTLTFAGFQKRLTLAKNRRK